MEPQASAGSDPNAGDKNLVLKLAAAGAAVVVGLGALYILTRPDPPKKKKSKKQKEKEREKEDRKKALRRKAAAAAKGEDEDDEEAEGDEEEQIEWDGDRGKPPAGRRAFDPAAAGVKQELMPLEDAQKWMDTFHDTEDVKSSYAALVPLLADLSSETAAVQENDKEGIMRTDFERWFITGFIAGLIATNPGLLIPQSLMVLRRMSAKKEDLSEAPMIIYAALLCSRTKEAMSTAFELWLSSQPPETMQNIKSEQQLTKLFEKALTEFSEMTMSYMPLILLGTYFTTRNEDILKQAMSTLERFFEALRKSRVKEQIEGFYRGTTYALTRFSAMDSSFKEWLSNYKTMDITLKRSLREALTGNTSPIVDEEPAAAAPEEAEEGDEVPVKRAGAAAAARSAKAAPRRKLASSGSRSTGRTSPPVGDEDQ